VCEAEIETVHGKNARLAWILAKKGVGDTGGTPFIFASVFAS
jgi:hypothetical protein